MRVTISQIITFFFSLFNIISVKQSVCVCDFYVFVVFVCLVALKPSDYLVVFVFLNSCVFVYYCGTLFCVFFFYYFMSCVYI